MALWVTTIRIRPNSNGKYSVFGRILKITIRYSPNCYTLSQNMSMLLVHIMSCYMH